MNGDKLFSMHMIDIIKRLHHKINIKSAIID